MSNTNSSAAIADNAAWRIISERETGQRYLSERQISKQTGVSLTRVRQMVDRCRAMRRAGVDVADGDWWASRMKRLPPDIAA